MVYEPTRQSSSAQLRKKIDNLFFFQTAKVIDGLTCFKKTGSPFMLILIKQT
jgi:hypothetical protein